MFKVFGGKSNGCGCCGTRIVGLRKIEVAGRSTGILGLDETFQEYLKGGRVPDEATGDDLVEDLRKLNFIAEGAEQMYREAFLREYRSYYESRKR